MSKINDKLNEVLDIANDVTVEEVKKTLPTVPEDKDPDIDFETGLALRHLSERTCCWFG